MKKGVAVVCRMVEGMKNNSCFFIVFTNNEP
jgi:hypothetical protein